MADQNDKTWGYNPDHLEPEAVLKTVSAMSPLYGPNRYFDLSVKGWENIPEAPALLVANHSGGTTIPDVWGLMFAWVKHFELSRIVHPLAHDMIFATRTTARAISRLGVLRANRENAWRVLTEWKRDVFVCPGGDKDTWRPWKERYKVRFSGRRGYARLALRAGRPIVPVAHAGAHETLIVLSDGARLARKLGLPQRFRAEIFPVHLSIPWGLAIGPLPHLPAPALMRYRIGTPIPVGEPIEDPSDAMVEQLDFEVQRSIQQMLDELAREQPTPRERLARVGRLVRGVVRRGEK